jgi:site-specific DNA-cytosine methylase
METHKRLITAVGACAFAGGFTWGLKQAGITPIGNLEFPGVSGHLKTHRRNFPDVPIFDGGPESWPLHELAAMEPDIVFAQPPCAPWSQAGFGPNRGINKHKTDPRVAWTKAAFSLVEELNPDVFIYESVQPTFYKTRESFLDPFALDCNLDGRSCVHLLLDGARVGLPHKRKRYFFIASRYELPFAEPPDISPPTSLETLSKVHSKLEPVWPRTIDKKNWENNLHLVEPGQSLAAAWTILNPPDKWEYGAQGQVKNRPAFGNYRLHPDRSPRTFFGSYTLIHPTLDRPLNFDEIVAISGYPPEFDWSTASSIPNAMVQMGQAVLPPVAKWVGDLIVRGLKTRLPAYADTQVLDYC